MSHGGGGGSPGRAGGGWTTRGGVTHMSPGVKEGNLRRGLEALRRLPGLKSRWVGLGLGVGLGELGA